MLTSRNVVLALYHATTRKVKQPITLSSSSALKYSSDRWSEGQGQSLAAAMSSPTAAAASRARFLSRARTVPAQNIEYGLSRAEVVALNVYHGK